MKVLYCLNMRTWSPGIITVVFFLFAGIGMFGQQVSGYVRDADNREPIPFASVWIKGTLQGMMTDEDGRFSLPVAGGDTLVVSSVGYLPKEVPISRGRNNELAVYLTNYVTEIGEVTVRPDVPLARQIFDKIQENKRANTAQIRGVSDYRALANTSVFMAIDTASRISRLSGNIKEITVESDNERIRFTPVYLAEEASLDERVIHTKKESIFPRIVPFIESYILNNTMVNLDFYRDQIFVLDRGFISPLNSSAMLYYNFYFNDSIFVDDQLYLNLSFVPRNRYNPLFTGNFTVEAGSYALTEIEAHISREANLNFVNGFSGFVTYRRLPDGSMFYDEQETRMNMSLTLNRDSVAKYTSERVDVVSSGNWLINKHTKYSKSDRLDDIRVQDWSRQPEFNSRRIDEENYYRVGQIREMKLVKAIDAVGGVALTGFFNVGKLDVGPVFDIYSSNLIEGHRFSVPLRTSEKVSENFSVGGFLGYGTKSEEFKYGGNFVWQPGDTDRFLFRFSYANDYLLISNEKFLKYIKNNPNNRGTGNFIAIMTQRERNPYLKEVENFDMHFEFNADNDMHLEVSPYFHSTTATPFVRFTSKGSDYKNYRSYGMLMNFRIPFGQHYDKFFFDRIYYVNPIPVINLSMDLGQVHIPGEGRQGLYTHFHGSIQGRINMGQIFMNYLFNAGYLFGDAPYELLNQPVGSMSLGFSRDRYNLLHHASFAHNAYTNTHVHFNGGGIILNRLPLIRDLKLREIVSIKSHYGTLNSSYKGVFDLPEYFSRDFTKPYTEIGFGVTNVFKFLRLEYVRQLGGTYRGRDYIDTSGFRMRAEMSF